MQVYEIFEDRSASPLMYGLQIRGGARVYRLTTDRAEVERLAAAFNQLRLSPIHFYDSLDDFRKS